MRRAARHRRLDGRPERRGRERYADERALSACLQDAVTDLEPHQQTRPIGLNRCLAHEQLSGYLGVRGARSDCGGYLKLSVAERRKPPGDNPVEARARKKSQGLDLFPRGKVTKRVRAGQPPRGGPLDTAPASLWNQAVSQASGRSRSPRRQYDEGPDLRFRRSGPCHRWWVILDVNQ